MIESATMAKNKTEKEGEVERIYRLLKTWLIECELAPGEFLAEVDLARRCETSRTPIREACNRLAQDGWITRIRHKGYLVTPVSVRDVLQLYEYRKVLECFSAEKASQVATAEQLDDLRRMIEVERDAKAGIPAIVPVNDRFHLGVAEIAGNQRLLDQLKLTLEYVHRLDKLDAARPYLHPARPSASRRRIPQIRRGAPSDGGPYRLHSRPHAEAVRYVTGRAARSARGRPAPSKHQLEAKLHLPGEVDFAGRLPEGGTGRRRVGRSERGMVQRVERFGAELELHLLGEIRVLQHRKV